MNETGPPDARHRMAPVWVRGAASIIQRLPAGRFRAAALLARTRPRPFVTRMAAAGGAMFWCDLTDEIARDACLAGVYEAQETGLLTRLLRPGMNVVDAGANWGYFTLLSAHLVGATGRVLALEPDPRVFALLQRNLSLNGLPQVTALPLAAGAARGVLTLDGYDPASGNRGVSRIHAAADPASATTFTVGSDRLDDVIAARGMEVVDLVKIDVEGAEDAVLAGMDDGLRARRYHRVLIELHPALLVERGATVDACCATLEAAGYVGWTLDHSAAAGRRAAYARGVELRGLISRADRPPAADPWPHMLWTLPAMSPGAAVVA